MWSTFTARGWRHSKELRTWQAVTFTSIPILTGISNPPPVQLMLQVQEQQIPALNLPQPSLEDWEARYKVKYLVKKVVREVLGREDVMTVEQLVRRVEEEVGAEVRDRKELVPRFVAKYFYKFNSHGN